MPGPIAHFRILMETYQSLLTSQALQAGDENIFKAVPTKSNTLFSSGSSKDQGISQFAYLGAVFPDVPYTNEEAIGFAADMFHYNRSSTFAIKLLDHAKGKKTGSEMRNIIVAFVLGFISHIAGDIVCHPYINTIAGAYWNQGVPLIDTSPTKVQMHMMTEVHQDSWLASNYFGLTNLSTTGASKSWSDFLNDLSLGRLVMLRKKQTSELFEEICRCFSEVYGRGMNLDSLWKAGNNYFELLDVGYDTAMDPLPDNPTEVLVNYDHRRNDYLFYLSKAQDLSKALCKKALDYNNGGQKEKDQLIKYLKDWNLDTGYCINVYALPSPPRTQIKSIHIRYEHSWCHNYGRYDLT
ncbi:MAG: zinc dependent phospholipase C family protein [Candidatus Bathyarchaeia archaeon]|jgi:hypothetical protein